MNDYKRVLEEKGILSFTPGGRSMWPIIANYEDTVIIEKPQGTLKRFDVAFYQRESGQPVLHRVMRVNADNYDMCGDSQTAIEKGIAFDAVFGVMTGYYKKGKYIDCRKNLLYKFTVRFWSSSILWRRILLKGLRILGIRPQ